MFARPAYCALVLFVACAVRAAVAPAAEKEQIAAGLAEVSPVVLPADQREAGVAMIGTNVRARIQVANDKSSALWREIKTRQQWEEFRDNHVAALKKSLARFPEPPKTLNVLVTGTVEGDGYSIDNVVFESRPGIWVTGNLYRPAAQSDSMPGILLSHSHHRPKEQGEQQDMGATWARAGCLVLAIDHLGHGERRQHPFATAADYDGEFALSRQDYYFRYDTGMQLHLLGDSLMGWLAWDLMRGVDLLLAQDGIDPARIVLLGAVAGGGDPAGVTGAIDPRITCVGPFNFGGPQPETRYPLPADAETSFNYAGGGSWESTRNIKGSAGGGFLHWVIVGSIAPRHLIYGHEFSWDGERDPVWKRFQKIYGFYDAVDRAGVAHGGGQIQVNNSEATHCTNIGRVHRRMIHPLLDRWFGIKAEEFDAPDHSASLIAMTSESSQKLSPKRLVDVLPALADARLAEARKQRTGRSGDELRRALRADWSNMLGNVEPAKFTGWDTVASNVNGDVTVESVVLHTEPGIQVPLLLLYPKRAADAKDKLPVVLAVSQGGKASLLEGRRDDVAALLAGGAAVCLPDLRGTGETRSGSERGQFSSDTSRSSTELMLGSTMVGARLRDLRGVLAWLRTCEMLDAQRLAVWGDSPAKVNSAETRIRMPHRIDGQPNQSEPLGGLLAMLLALYEDDVRAVYASGGLCDFRSVLGSQFVLIPHDVVIPGVAATCDLPDLAAALAPLPLRLEATVDENNRPQSPEATAKCYRATTAAYAAAAEKFQISEPRTSAAWLLSALK
jgi:hypothetical protein